MGKYKPISNKELHGVDVDKLEVGDKLFNKNADSLEITSIEVIDNKIDIPTYNLIEIYKHNNYFANDVLVHNKKDSDINKREMQK